MGFGSFLDVFKSDNWSNELVDMVSEMIELGSEMYQFAIGVILEGKPSEGAQSLIYERDKRINKLERKIRRRVVSHLSMQGSRAEVPTALILMNVVKDGERIGDYVKNLYEISDMMPAAADRQLYRDQLEAISTNIGLMFSDTRAAFAESDEELAGKVIKSAKASGREFEAHIRELTVSDLDVNNAVCMVLMLRFYKRLVAHMGNIASAVVMPVDLIDYYDESDN